MEFIEFTKIARLSRECVITEKIDGTNGQILIQQDDDGGVGFYVGSRTRWITPENDNHGFARWAHDNSEELIAGLGIGRHFGEWWGSGIQRGYGLTKGEKRFSLFNTHRWSDDNVRPKCCHVVPILRNGIFSTDMVMDALYHLERDGSMAAPGFMKPEGVVIFHTARNYLFKKTIDGDGHKCLTKK